MTRACTRCKVGKRLNDFYRDRSKASGRHTICKTCVLAAAKTRYDANPEAARAKMRDYYARNAERFVAYGLRARYNMTVDDLAEMMRRQGGRCATCRRARRLHIDHDHDTGKVRGLLCSGCNRGIGFLGDDPTRMRAAADYLEAMS